jgi:MFS family permease
VEQRAGDSEAADGAGRASDGSTLNSASVAGAVRQPGEPGAASRFASTAGGAGRGAVAAARAGGRAAAVASRVAGKGAGATARRLRRATHAEGAGESGLARIIELHALNSAGDALITIALANTLFFSVPVGEARGRVALYLLITMAPFSVMAPVIGPILDRLRSGRRYAIAATMLARAFLCWVMAGAISDNGLALYPAAFGALVASKAYGVTRSAVVPRVLPEEVSLVRANSRITLAGILAGLVAAAIGAGLAAAIGPEWGLRLGFVIFTFGLGMSIALPKRVDSSEGEERARLESDAKSPERRLRSVGPSVVLGLRANATLRAFSGFLTMFLAFLLRQSPIGGLKDTAAIGLVAGAAAVGNTFGTTLGAWLRTRAPELIITSVLAITAATAATGAWFYRPRRGPRPVAGEALAGRPDSTGHP